MGGAKKIKKPGTEKVLVGTRLILLNCNRIEIILRNSQWLCDFNVFFYALMIIQHCLCYGCVYAQCENSVSGSILSYGHWIQTH